MNKKLIQKYNEVSEPGSFSGFATFYHALTPDQKKKATKTELKKWFQKQESNTFHYPRKTRFPRNQVVVGGIDKTWQADLAVFDNIVEYNDGFRYVSVVIDVISKYTEPMKKKDAKNNEGLSGKNSPVLGALTIIGHIENVKILVFSVTGFFVSIFVGFTCYEMFNLFKFCNQVGKRSEPIYETVQTKPRSLFEGWVKKNPKTAILHL